MSQLKKHYADQIKIILHSCDPNGITKQELMKKMSITTEKFMDSVLKDVSTISNIRCKDGRVFLKDTVPMEIRDYIRKHFMVNDDIEVKVKR